MLSQPLLNSTWFHRKFSPRALFRSLQSISSHHFLSSEQLLQVTIVAFMLGSFGACFDSCLFPPMGHVVVDVFSNHWHMFQLILPICGTFLGMHFFKHKRSIYWKTLRGDSYLIELVGFCGAKWFWFNISLNFRWSITIQDCHYLWDQNLFMEFVLVVLLLYLCDFLSFLYC